MPIRKLVAFDFCCALIGTFAYIFLFGFLVDDLQIPFPVAMGQLIANFLYSLYGIFLFRSNSKNLAHYMLLVRMNIIYGAVCFLLSVFLWKIHAWPGYLLLLAEASIVAGLGAYEWRVFKSKTGPF